MATTGHWVYLHCTVFSYGDCYMSGVYNQQLKKYEKCYALIKKTFEPSFYCKCTNKEVGNSLNKTNKNVN